MQIHKKPESHSFYFFFPPAKRKDPLDPAYSHTIELPFLVKILRFSHYLQLNPHTGEDKYKQVEDSVLSQTLVSPLKFIFNQHPSNPCNA